MACAEACGRFGIARVYGSPRDTVNARSRPGGAVILTGVTSAPTHEGSKPPCLREDALAVLTRLREAGHVAYFAGGCVRDELLGLTPKDYDVATDAPPDRVRKLFSNTQAVGAAFGVILVRHRRSVVEVATFRTDGKYLDGRRPEAVTFTTAEEDAKRRDFTINGMFLDPIENKVIDYVGGQEDLKNKVLRAIGDPNQRFEEDHLRLLRAIRFAARFGLTIERVTTAAIATHAKHLPRISPERIADELRQILTAPSRETAWPMLWELQLVQQVMRFMPGPHPQQLDLTRSIVTRLAPQERISFGTVLAAAAVCYRWQSAPRAMLPFDSLDRSLIVSASKALRQALKISNEELDDLSGTLKDLLTLFSGATPSVALLKRFLAGPTARGTRALLAAMEAVPNYDWRQVASLRADLTAVEKTDVAPRQLVTGDDLTDAGLKPGPRFKVALDQTYDAQLEGRVTTRKAAIEMAIRIAKGEPA